MPDASEPSEQSATTRRISASLVEGLQLRLELLAFEVAEERRRLLRLVLSTLGMAVAGFMSFLSLNAALLIYFWNTYRIELVIGMCVFYFLVSGALALGVWTTNRRSEGPFSALIATLNDDRHAFRDRS